MDDTTSLPASSNQSLPDPTPAHHASPVVAFIIGLAIVLLASILNAAGLNLTKLDHVKPPYLSRPRWHSSCFGRFELVLYQKLRDGETGFDLFGYWEWYSICEYP